MKIVEQGIIHFGEIQIIKIESYFCLIWIEMIRLQTKQPWHKICTKNLVPQKGADAFWQMMCLALLKGILSVFLQLRE